MLQFDPTENTSEPHFGPQEIVSMAMKLVAKHGASAVDVAHFFADEHQILEDLPRSWVWQVVACTADDILAGRYFDHEITVH